MIKHFFEHRYDYRSEWLRFSATIAEGRGAGSSPEERVIRSVADVTESTGGLLLLVDRQGRLEHAGGWHWATEPLEGAIDANPSWTQLLEKSGRIITLDTLRSGEGSQEEAGLVPSWLLDTHEAWAAVPLVRSHRLIGLVVLGRPRVDRLLDWEDFDLLKVIGQQAAIHLAETQSQSELDEARRFDEFNRRFAFIIHDIKNVVSQLSLVASNAEQHGANPRFQRDMVDTLKNASIKMNTLLSRLSSKRSFAEAELSDVDVSAMLEVIAADRRAQHEISVIAEREVRAWADPEKLRLAIDHLVQNAIEASPASDPIVLGSTELAGRARITVSDKGPGMSAEFVRRDLFKPFLSTKEGGFGIGAAEARSLVAAMDGTLDVATAEGRGARFTIELAASR
jgi:putative PEP-CTERM system histidine kinase